MNSNLSFSEYELVNKDINFYFILSIPSLLLKNKVVKVKELSKYIEIPQIKILEEKNYGNEKFSIILFCYKIDLWKNYETDFQLILEVNNHNYVSNKIILNSKKDTFYYKRIKFEIEKKYFGLKTSNPPKSIIIEEKLLFNYYFNYILTLKNSNENIFEIFFEEKIKELLLAQEFVDKENFVSIDNYFSLCNFYKTKSYQKFINELMNKICNSNKVKKWFDFVGFLITNFNKRNLPEKIQMFLEKIFQKNIKYVSSKIGTFFFFLNFIQFHTSWIRMCFNNFNISEDNLKSYNGAFYLKNYQQTIFKIIKNPLFLTEEINENKLNIYYKDFIFMFIYFSIKNPSEIPEFKVIISSNQLDYIFLICKGNKYGKYYDYFIQNFIIIIDNYDELQNWFIESCKQDSIKTLKTLVFNKEYLFIILKRENQKLLFNEENYNVINKNIDDINKNIKILLNFNQQIKSNVFEFGEDLLKRCQNTTPLQTTTLTFEVIYNSKYIKHCNHCNFYVHNDIYETHLNNNCYNNKLICYNCFHSFLLYDYLKHNFDNNKCYKSEEFMKDKIEKILINSQIIDLADYQIIDKIIKKNEFYNTKSYDLFVKNIIIKLTNNSNNITYYDKWLESLKFFENYFYQNNYNQYYDLLINNLIQIIPNHANENYWFELVQFFSQIFLNKKLIKYYDSLMKNIINLLSQSNFTKRNDWFQLVQYFKKDFNDKEFLNHYDNLIKSLIKLFSDSSFLQNEILFIFIKHIHEELLTKQYFELYKIFFTAIIEMIKNEYCIKRKDWFDILKFFEQELSDKKLEQYYKELINGIIYSLSNKKILENNNWYQVIVYFSNLLLNKNLMDDYNSFMTNINQLLNSPTIILKKNWFELVNYFENIYIEKKYTQLYNNLINHIIVNFTKNNISIKFDWFDIIKHYLEYFLENNYLEFYNNFMNKIVIILSNETVFINRLNDYHKIIFYINEQLIKNQFNELYNLFIKNILIIFDKKYYLSNDNWFEIFKYFEISLYENKFYEYYEKFINIIIPILDNCFENKKNGYEIMVYFVNKLVEKKYFKLRNDLLSIIIEKHYNYIKKYNEYIIYFLEFGQYSHELTNLLIKDINIESLKLNIKFTSFEEFFFLFLKKPIKNNNEQLIENNLKLGLTFLNQYKKNEERDIPEFVIFVSECQFQYYSIILKNNSNIFTNISMNLFDNYFQSISSTIQLENWIHLKKVSTNSLITMRIMLRNKEFIFFVCQKDLSKISFEEDNMDFINQNKNEFALIIQCFNNFMKSNKYIFIEFGKNLKSIQTEIKKEINGLIYCQNCGFKVIPKYYSEHLNSNCDELNLFMCYNCFNYFNLEEFVKHNENSCLRNLYENSKNEIKNCKNTIKNLSDELTKSKNRICDLENQISSLINEINNYKFQISHMNEEIKLKKEKINNLEDNIKNLNQTISNLKSEINSLQKENTQLKDEISSLNSKVDQLQKDKRNLNDDIDNLKNDKRNLENNINQLNKDIKELEDEVNSLKKDSNE